MHLCAVIVVLSDYLCINISLERRDIIVQGTPVYFKVYCNWQIVIYNRKFKLHAFILPVNSILIIDVFRVNFINSHGFGNIWRDQSVVSGKLFQANFEH